jgi:glutamine phosphoribosylpyrophosphate amidotransferase
MNSYRFIRNHYVGRTFLHPAQDAVISVSGLNLTRSSVLKGKKGCGVDDSIVSGTR